MAARNSSLQDHGDRDESATPAGAEAIATNVLRPTPDRARDREPDAPAARDTDRRIATARRATTENSIRPSKRKVQPKSLPPLRQDVKERKSKGNNQNTTAPTELRQEPGRATAPTTVADAHAIPEEVRRQFVQVGRKYYFPDGARAFTDRGKRLTTPSENTEVIRTLVTIAQARGWSDITVSGTERFRKEAWFAAKRAGLDARGYKASDFEHEQLVRSLAPRTDKRPGSPAAASPSASAERASAPARASEREPARDSRAGTETKERRDGLITGRLVDHGRATYQHDPHEPISYFAKLETPRGERTIWGVDLERAFKESLTKPQAGDEVGLRALRQDAVTVKARERDSEGRLVGEKDLATHRNRWIVETRAFFEERNAAARALRDSTVEPKRAVRDHPALVGTYLNLHAAELAAKRFRDPQDQQKFVSLVRNALADAVARGEPLPPVRLRERSGTRDETRRPERTQVPVRG